MQNAPTASLGEGQADNPRGPNKAIPAKAHDRAKRAAHVIYLARRAEAAMAAPATGRPPKK